MEKDLWVTEVLRGVVGQASQEDITVIFKGGTSRSKAYRLIKCFSEDVDMLVVLPTRGSDVMARDVCTYSLAARLAASPRPVKGFAARPAFAGSQHLPFARREYGDRVVGQLRGGQANWLSKWPLSRGPHVSGEHGATCRSGSGMPPKPCPRRGTRLSLREALPNAPRYAVSTALAPGPRY